ncbi:hypothetical protein DVH24_030104 [Malus domestica]|uniref:Uncharacterized protein n=1 Tax=Malus domestica TaxID=3750 RepID=A0A498I2T1_MALDO|nr:hypothetical protein DVH24_030104 [Malus domestica]
MMTWQERFNVDEDCPIFDSLFDICQASADGLVRTDVIPIWVVEFEVLTRVELVSEQQGDEGDNRIGEEAKVLVGEGVGRREDADGLELGVVDESEVGDIGDVGEGVEEEVKSRGGARKRWLRRRMMRTTENDGWVDGASLWEVGE